MNTIEFGDYLSSICSICGSICGKNDSHFYHMRLLRMKVKWQQFIFQSYWILEQECTIKIIFTSLFIIGKLSNTIHRLLIQDLELGFNFLVFILCSFYHISLFLIWCFPTWNSGFTNENLNNLRQALLTGAKEIFLIQLVSLYSDMTYRHVFKTENLHL